MITTGTEQRSLGWFRSRLGHFTGSMVYNIMVPARKKDEIFGETAKTYMKQLAGQRLLNPAMVEDDQAFQDYLDKTSVTTRAMRIGAELEDEAVSVFAEVTEGRYNLTEVASCRHDSIPWFAASPDRVFYDSETGDMGVLEVKCPTEGIFVGYATEITDADTLKKEKKEYYWQMMAEMACTGACFGYFFCYNPDLIHPYHMVRIERNEADIRMMEERVILANQFINAKLSRIA